MIDDDEELDWGPEGPPQFPQADYSGAARTRRYDSRRRQRGQVRVSVWVPADRVAELQEIAARMRG